VKIKDILDVYIKFGTKLFHWTWGKKGNLRQIIRKVNKKVNLKVLGVSPYVSKGVPNHAWTLIIFFNYGIYLIFTTKYFSTQCNDKIGWDFIVPN